MGVHFEFKHPTKHWEADYASLLGGEGRRETKVGAESCRGRVMSYKERDPSLEHVVEVGLLDLPDVLEEFDSGHNTGRANTKTKTSAR